jgi:hypothetical protein
MEEFDVGAVTDLIQDGPHNQSWPATENEFYNALILLEEIVIFIYN